ncbi:hypothetical protein LCGC14_2942430 [marine sediment metagenome]|uniref:Uncharacterized protein n=1 Tax=marine sediment metagenome TaxID=412755 RepID=A0A0F8Y4M9_9ZZZZ
MQVIEDEVIGELRYLTVKFDQAEIIADGGVISQGAAQRYFAKERPDLKIKKCGSFKLNPQERTVTMRVGVVDKPLLTLTGADGSKIEGEKLENCGCGERKNQAVTVTVSDEVSKVKFLNPGYDEIQAKCVTFQREYDAIVILYDKLETRYSKLIEKYDALVTAVSKDAQKFSDLLVENERLNKYIEHCGGPDEDSADLADAKEVIESADSVPLSEVEGDDTTTK